MITNSKSLESEQPIAHVSARPVSCLPSEAPVSPGVQTRAPAAGGLSPVIKVRLMTWIYDIIPKMFDARDIQSVYAIILTFIVTLLTLLPNN